MTIYYSGPNGSIGYRYYPSGRLAKLIYPGGNDSTGHVEYTYYSDGRLKDVIDRLGGSARTTTYTWYSDGRLAIYHAAHGSTAPCLMTEPDGRRASRNRQAARSSCNMA